MRPSWLGADEPDDGSSSGGSGSAGGSAGARTALMLPTRWGRHTDGNLAVMPDGLTLAYEVPAAAPSSSAKPGFLFPPRPLVAVAQADRGFSVYQGLCYFEITVADVGLSGDIYIGLTHASHPLNAHIGSTERSYGLYLRDQLKFRGGKQLRWNGSQAEPSVKSGDIIGCGINNTTHEVFFTYNGRALPGQLKDIHGELYPTVSLCSQGARIIAQFCPPFQYSISLNWAPSDLVDYLPRELCPGSCGSSLTLSEANTVVEYTGTHEGINGLVLADQPFNPARNISYFEIEILSHGKKGWVAVGLCVPDYPLTHHPGWRHGSWGYHGDDGRKFGASGTGEPFGPTYTVGDVIGIGLNHGRREMFCTKNGFFLGVAFSGIDEEILFPCVGLHSPGEKVRARFQPPFVFQSETIDRAFTSTPKLKRSITAPNICSLPQSTAFPDVNSLSAIHSLMPELKDFRTWTPEQVGLWLESTVNLGQYRKLFMDNDITGEMLESLSDSDILKKELGISSFGHRIQLVKHIQNLFDNSKIETQHTEKSASSGSVSLPPRRGSIPSSPLQDTTGRTSSETRVRYEELEMGECIGKGFFGEVRRARWRGTDVAVKVIYRRSFRSHDEFELFEKEVSVLSMLRHPCIVQFMGVCLGSKNCIVTEFMAGGNLENFVVRNMSIFQQNPYLRVRIITNIAKGMCYLHGWTPEPILHRDLTPRNILLDKHFNCKVADFGLSRAKGENRMTEGVGFLPFQAPEVFKGEEYSEKADVYSFGMLVWFLFTGRQPDEGFQSALRMANMVAHRDYRPPLPDTMPEHWKVVVRACWHPRPSARPSFSELLHTIERYKELQSDGSGYLLGDLLSPASSSVSSTQPASDQPVGSAGTDHRPAHSYPQHSISMPSLNAYYYEEHRSTRSLSAEDEAFPIQGSQSAPPQRRSGGAASEDWRTLPAELEEQCRIASQLRGGHHYADGSDLSSSSNSDHSGSEGEARVRYVSGVTEAAVGSLYPTRDGSEHAGEEGDVIAARLFRPAPS